MASSKSKKLLYSVQNGLAIIKLFTKEKPIWGITEISRELNLPKSSVSRLTSDLADEGFLKKSGRQYHLGLSLLRLAGLLTTHLEITREAAEPLNSLVNKIQETAHVSIMEDDKIVYLLKHDCKHPVRLHSYIGKDNPAVCTSSGLIILAYQSIEQITEVIGKGLPQRGPNSFINKDDLLRELKYIKENGYAICIDVLHIDAVSIAAPIRDYTGNVMAAVTVAGPRQRITESKIIEITSEIIKTAEVISDKLGYLGTGI
ncbi:MULTISPECIES: IclR family transcriptional regulator [Cytobacillus]|uniref:IclR family transcriptional regulator n=1 Tax=Cytobacillus TaxID=2675230 RepID=UPI00203A3F95|nr:IclR family transcriptional regulator [Cytobacillus firmus]MCM3706610.1 IclR family transcriptional regulator [Cytobacillus firmus]